MKEAKTKTEEHTIDASGRNIGRVATEAAMILMGKNSPTYRANVSSGNKVLIENAGRMLIPAKKRKEKIYTRYSGYPGGLKKESMEYVLKKKGVEEVLKRAVYGMIPSNKLRKDRMKNLEIKA